MCREEAFLSCLHARRFVLDQGARFNDGPVKARRGFAGRRDLGSVKLDLNLHFNFIVSASAFSSLLAGFLAPKSPLAH